MRALKKTDLKLILSAHKLWLESDGEDGKRADLTEADLIGTNLENTKR